MNTNNIAPIRRHRCLVLTRLLPALVLLAGISSAVAPARAQVDGNTYISPNFGCAYSWDGNWFVTEEESTPNYDVLGLSNGLAYVSLYCELNNYSSLGLALAITTGGYRSDPHITDIAPLADETGAVIRGEGSSRTFAAFSYTYTFDDGTTQDYGVYFEVRLVGDGDTLLSVVADIYLEDFLSQYELAGVTLPEPYNQNPNQVTVGEPAPVFADGFWRIGVAAGARGPALPGLELAEKAGKEWMVMIVDVTNWSDAGRDLSARDVRLTLAGASKPARIAPASTVSLGSRLGFPALTEDATILIGPGETVRIAIVYSIAAGSTVEYLTIGEARLPVADLLDLQMSPETLPPPANAPETVLGVLSSASDGRTMRVQVAGEPDAQRIRLLGVDPPAKGACMEHEAENVLDDLVGQSVMVEEDSALTGDDNSQRYVWLVNDDGSRTLLNQKLIAEGLATAAPIPGDARFALWLQTSEQDAESGEVGLWAGCEEPKPTATTAAKATATPAEAKATPTSTRETTPIPQPAVRWSGEIDQVGTITFTIDDGALTRLSINYSIACIETGATRTGGGNVTFDVPKSIASGSFTTELGITATDSILVTGLIMSDTSIVGTVTVPVIDDCTAEETQARWSAEPV